MEFKLGQHPIGDGHPVFFIAEAGVNHNGQIELGRQLVDASAAAGADAVKFQTFVTENLSTRKAPKSTYHIETTGDDKRQTWFELLKTQEMSRQMHVELIAHCRAKGIMFLSTPYDFESADLLFELGVPAFKMASTDTSNLPLIRHIAKMKRPLILSTAMCEQGEVEQAVAAARGEGLAEIVVLQCTGNYPSALKDSNLRVIPTFRRALNCLIGYSDHTVEMINPVAAVALGACVYEKHFTLDKSLPGPDHRLSLDPKELTETIRVIRQTEAALGAAEKRVLPAEQENRQKLRKSLVAATSLRKGETLTREMVAIKRPATGIAPTELERFLGRRLAEDVSEDTVLVPAMFL